ncbi:unnamed protein product [Lathyrus oleraceus]
MYTKVKPVKAIAKVNPILQKVGDGEYNLQEAVAQQPIIGLLFWQSIKSYKSDIFGNLPIKETMDISHEVSLIGYGREGEDSYWLIKSSWNTTWSEAEYGKIKRKGASGVTIRKVFYLISE